MAWLQTYISGTLQNWAHRLELKIDYTKIDENISNFPVAINISESSGQNNVDVSDIIEHLRGVGVLFSEDFSTSTAWEDIAGTTDYSNGYLHQTVDSQRARTTDYINYGKEWSITFKFRHYGQGAYQDYFHVNPILDTSLDLGLTLYTSSSSNYYLRTIVNGSAAGDITDYNWYNLAGTWFNVFIKKEGDTINFKVWPESVSEPVDWQVSTVVDSFPEIGKFDVWAQHVSSTGADVDDIVVDGYVDFYQKIAFTDSSGDTETHAEIEFWDYANKNAKIWTKVPSISATSDTVLYLYYDNRATDNSTYVGNTSSAAARAVWDQYFLAVYHMGNDPTTENLISSCDANADFVGTFNSMSSTNLVDTSYGKALTFDGVADWINISWVKRLGVQTLETTIEAFVKGTGYVISSDRTGAGMGDAGFIVQADEIKYQVYNMLSTAPYSTFFTLTPPGFNAETEFSYAGFAVSNNNIDICANEYSDSLVFNWSWSDGSPTAYDNIKLFKHQNYSYNTQYFTGQCVELRISSVDRSKAWMKATNFAIKDELLKFPPQLYRVAGEISENALPVIRKIRLYNETTGMLVSETYSNSEGYYELDTPYTNPHYIVCMDEVGGQDYNHLIKKDVELEAL